MAMGECRPRCGPDQPCVDRGGVPHVCIDLGSGPSCYPGALHLPCEADSDCIGDLKCLEVTTIDLKDRVERRRRCSAACQIDDDCKANRFAGNTSFCHEGACIARYHPGLRCESDVQCLNACRPSPVPAEAAMMIRRCS
jgi:hypothetical protein